MANIKMGVIGYGNMGTTHCRNIAGGKVAGMELAAICDHAKEREEAAKINHPDVAFFENATLLMKSGICDAVLIATPHYDHPKMAIEAFDCGLDVIIEKPAGVYTKQVLEMNDAAEKKGKLFGIM